MLIDIVLVLLASFFAVMTSLSHDVKKMVTFLLVTNIFIAVIFFRLQVPFLPIFYFLVALGSASFLGLMALMFTSSRPTEKRATAWQEWPRGIVLGLLATLLFVSWGLIFLKEWDFLAMGKENFLNAPINDRLLKENFLNLQLLALFLFGTLVGSIFVIKKLANK